MADRVVRPAEIRDTRSLGEIVQDILRDMQNVIRSELRLARTEMTEKARRAGKAGGLLGAAAVSGLFAAACLVVTCIAALALAMPVWLAALLTAIFLACIAGACYAGGRSRLRKVNPVPEQTVQSVKEDIEWARQRTR
ncbi:MAG: phage holin family protein [Acidobacteriia bacterium]|nr:phage holin family protein [Terriglobia bacterium]